MHRGTLLSRLKVTQSQALVLMAFAALLVSTGGIGFRMIEQANGLEVSFWRSLFAAAALAATALLLYGPVGIVRQLRRGGPLLLASSMMWAVMFTAFMCALSLTSVANVLVVISLDPLLAALAARGLLKHEVRQRTWLCAAAACVGIVVMVGGDLHSGSVLGMAIASLIPLASSANWTLSHYVRSAGGKIDLLPALLLGSVLAAAFAIQFAYPLQATPHDMAVLAGLGLIQCALPCAIAVICARTLEAPQLALLALLEVAFGIAWVWLRGIETPTLATVGGLAMIVGAVLAHELLPRTRAADCSP